MTLCRYQLLCSVVRSKQLPKRKGDQKEEGQGAVLQGTSPNEVRVSQRVLTFRNQSPEQCCSAAHALRVPA